MLPMWSFRKTKTLSSSPATNNQVRHESGNNRRLDEKMRKKPRFIVMEVKQRQNFLQSALRLKEVCFLIHDTKHGYCVNIKSVIDEDTFGWE